MTALAVRSCALLGARIVTMLAMSGADALAAAGPPLVTDDPGTPGEGRWEINVGWTHERRNTEILTGLPLLDISYGIGERVQLGYGVTWTQTRHIGAQSISGPRNSALSVKWRFVDGGDAGLAVSMRPQIDFDPSGSTWVLPLQFQYTLHGIDWNVEIGRRFPAGQDAWLYGLAASRALGERVEIAAELVGSASTQSGVSSLLANLGARFALRAQTTLLVALGRDLHDDLDPPGTLQAYVALQFTSK